MAWGMPRFFALLCLLLLIGCGHTGTESAGTGVSSFTIIEAGRAATDSKIIVGDVGEPSPGKYNQDYNPAAPLKGQPLPVYPARALKAKAGAATVGVRVTVDKAGRVTEIGPSLLVFNTPGPWAEDFLEAVKEAVRQWKFRPAEILQVERAEAPGLSYNRIARREPVESQIDLAFTFTATGGVQAK